MANDVDIYDSGGGLTPYEPSQPLAPIDDWSGDESIDYLAERHVEPENYQQQQENLAQLEGVFLSDMLRLGHDRKLINAVADCFRSCVGKDVSNTTKNNPFKLFQWESDPVFVHISNHLYQIGATQEFITHLAWWSAELYKRMGLEITGSKPAPVAAKNQEYTDREWAEIIRLNEIARDRTEVILRERWHSSYEQNVMTVKNFLANLPASDRQYLDRLTDNKIHTFNDAGVVLRLFDMATGANNLPARGALALADEIASIEKIMREDRRRYNNDLRMQARLRTLYSIRDGS